MSQPILTEPPPRYRATAELAWIDGKLCQKWYPVRSFSPHDNSEWVLVPSFTQTKSEPQGKAGAR